MSKLRKPVSILLSVILILSVFTIVPFSAGAEENRTLYVGGVKVTEDNCDDVLDNGTVSYDSFFNTLRLENAEIEMKKPGDLDMECGVYYKGNDETPLTIVLEGDNSLVDQEEEGARFAAGLYLDRVGDRSPRITGVASLSITGGENKHMYGIRTTGNNSSTRIEYASVSVSHTSAASEVSSNGILCDGELLLKSGASVRVEQHLNHRSLCLSAESLDMEEDTQLELITDKDSIDSEMTLNENTLDHDILVNTAPSAEGAQEWDGSTALNTYDYICFKGVSPWQRLCNEIAAAEGSEVFVLDRDYTGADTDDSITIESGAEIEIDLNGHTINRNCTIDHYNSGTAILVKSGGKLEMYDSSNGGTVTGGNSNSGGAIYNAGELTVTNISFTDNNASYKGAALYNKGTATLTGCLMQNNKAWMEYDGEFDGSGGAIYNDGTLTVNSSFMENNEAGMYGGAIYNAGDLTLDENTYILSNSAHKAGGGVYNTGQLAVYDAEVISNQTILTSYGGVYSDNDVKVHGNSRIHRNMGSNLYLTGNHVIKVDGGFDGDAEIGISVENFSRLVTSGLTSSGNSDISMFAADEHSNAFYLRYRSGEVYFGKSIDVEVSSWAQLQQEINSATAPKTIALANSVTAGSGDTRIEINGYKDITLDLNGNTLDRALSPDAEYDRNGHVIEVHNNGKLTIINSDVGYNGFITGGNAENGGGINVNLGGSCTIYGGIITNNVAENGGGIYNRGTLTMNGGRVEKNTTTRHGGGICNHNTMSLAACTIYDNECIHNDNGYGGGVYNDAEDESVILSEATHILGNRADKGAGVYVEEGPVNLSGVIIEGNKAERSGGGIYTNSSGTGVKCYDCNISTNLAKNNNSYNSDEGLGGGIFVQTGKVEMHGGKMTFNTGEISGGAVYVTNNTTFTGDGALFDTNDAVNGGAVFNNASLTLENCELKRNTATESGGAVYNNARMTLNGCTLTKNSADVRGGAVYSRVTASINGNTVMQQNNAAYGGGLYVADGTTSIKDITVRENNATKAGGGIYQKATLKVEDEITVEDNTVGGNTENNVYLQAGKTLSVSGWLTSSHIGVTFEDGGKMKATSGYSDYHTGYNSEVFFADNPPVFVVDVNPEFFLKDNEVWLKYSLSSVTYIERDYSPAGELCEWQASVEDPNILVSSESDVWIGGGQYYVVASDVVINGALDVGGNAKLILCDGAKLTANHNVQVNSDKGVDILTIYGQENDTGKLIAYGDSGDAAIGSNRDAEDSGAICICGGDIEAHGGKDAAGIGGSTHGAIKNENDRKGVGLLEVYGGRIKAYGGERGAGIGGGYYGGGGIVEIYGGEVYAEGGCKDYFDMSRYKITGETHWQVAAGIGGGGTEGFINAHHAESNEYLKPGPGCDVEIYGGKVYARAQKMGCAIGGGVATLDANYGDGYTGAAGSLKIYGGEVRLEHEETRTLFGKNGTLEIFDGAAVFEADHPIARSKQLDTIRKGMNVTIKACTHDQTDDAVTYVDNDDGETHTVKCRWCSAVFTEPHETMLHCTKCGWNEDTCDVTLMSSADGDVYQGASFEIGKNTSYMLPAPALTPEGMVFIGWRIKNGNTLGNTLYHENDVYTVYDSVIFMAQYGVVHAVNVAPNIMHGSVFVNTDSASPGETVLVSVEPQDGYAVTSVTANGTELTPGANGVYSFEMPDEDVTVNAGLVYDDGFGAKIAGYSISLDGDIAVNFYMELSQDIIQSQNDPYMLFTIPTTSTEYQTQYVYLNKNGDDTRAVAYNVPDTNYYIFKCRVPAKDMESEITAQMSNGVDKGNSYTYSVKQYAEYLLENRKQNEEWDKAAPLVEAMLAYGDQAKAFFDASDTEDAELIQFDDQIPEGEYANTLTEDGAPVFVGATLSLKSRTTLSLYFKSEQELTLTCEGKEVETRSNGDDHVIRIRGIAIMELDQPITVNVSYGESSGTVTYSPLRYCYLTANNDDSSNKLKNTVNALYNYHLAAKAYFNDDDPQPGSGLHEEDETEKAL